MARHAGEAAGWRGRAVGRRFPIGRRVALAAAAATALAVPDVAAASFPGKNGRIAYGNCDAIYCSIFAIDRGGPRLVAAGGTFGPVGARVVVNWWDPSWSPDGQWIAAFRLERQVADPLSGKTELWIMRGDGSDARRIVGATRHEPITWSPDGARLAYTQSGQLVVVNVSGTPTPRVLPPTDVVPGSPPTRALHAREGAAWSPDGDVIAIEYFRSGAGGASGTKGIGLISPEAEDLGDFTPVTTLPERLPTGTNNYASHSEPDFSPDGEQIAYVHGELLTPTQGTARIERIGRGGTGATAVTDYPGEDETEAAEYTEDPVWSPDGDWIVWKLTSGSTAKWEGARPDGSGRADLDVVGGDLTWQPCAGTCPSIYPGFVFDRVAPETTITQGPAGTSADATPAFSFASSEAGSTFTCRVDGAAFAPCSSPMTVGPLADGPHRFEVRATDAAGNTDATPAVRDLVVDRAPPETTITYAPAGVTDDANPMLMFTSSEAGSTFACRVDGAAFAPCSSPMTVGPLADGPHRFEVRATDPAGNQDATPATATWTVSVPVPGTPGGGTTVRPPTDRCAVAAVTGLAAGCPPPPGSAPPRFRLARTTAASTAGTLTLTLLLDLGARGRLEVLTTIRVRSRGRTRTVVVARRRLSVRAGRIRVTLVPGREARSLLRRRGSLRASLRVGFAPATGRRRTIEKAVTFRYAPRRSRR